MNVRSKSTEKSEVSHFLTDGDFDKKAEYIHPDEPVFSFTVNLP
jgi:hypothetical protein